jgi:hypothetical protein
MGQVSKAALWQEAKLRILGLALVGSLALIVPIAARSAPPGSNTGQSMTGPAHSGLIQVGDGHASNWSRRPAVEVAVGTRRIGDRAVSMAVATAGQEFKKEALRSLAFHCPLDPPTTALSCTPARSSNNLIVAVLRKSVGCARQ